MNFALASNEPLSPELVLVLPPELRAQVLARLPTPPLWPVPRRLVLADSPADDRAGRSLGRVLVVRAAQLAQIFVTITILTLAMALIAHRFR